MFPTSPELAASITRAGDGARSVGDGKETSDGQAAAHSVHTRREEPKNISVDDTRNGQAVPSVHATAQGPSNQDSGNLRATWSDTGDPAAWMTCVSPGPISHPTRFTAISSDIFHLYATPTCESPIHGKSRSTSTLLGVFSSTREDAAPGDQDVFTMRRELLGKGKGCKGKVKDVVRRQDLPHIGPSAGSILSLPHSIDSKLTAAAAAAGDYRLRKRDVKGTSEEADAKQMLGARTGSLDSNHASPDSRKTKLVWSDQTCSTSGQRKTPAPPRGVGIVGGLGGIENSGFFLEQF